MDKANLKQNIWGSQPHATVQNQRQNEDKKRATETVKKYINPHDTYNINEQTSMINALEIINTEFFPSYLFPSSSRLIFPSLIPNNPGFSPPHPRRVPSAVHLHPNCGSNRACPAARCCPVR